MRYFHRTSLPPDDVLAEAERYFGSALAETERTDRSRRYEGAAGSVTVRVRPEGGHYVHIAVETNQVGESEIDKMAKRFLGLVHTRAHPAHEIRGAY